MSKKSHKEIEKEEERTGIDLDGDGEKGESKEHKDKIEKARLKKFKEWLVETHPEEAEKAQA
jgi:hypothetical protein